jgi:hypothetical protein
MRIAYKISIEKPVGKRRFRRPGRRWEDNTKMDLKIVWPDYGRLASRGSG